jgi:hypothetical protein
MERMGTSRSCPSGPARQVVERHPVAARVLQNTMAQTALLGSGARFDALRDTISELLSMDEPRKRFAAMMSGLDIHYDLGEGHPLLVRRMPDLGMVIFLERCQGEGSYIPIRTGQASAQTVVATDSTSPDADYDNGAALQHTKGPTSFAAG